MTLTITRKNIEGAMKLKILPPSIQKLLDAVPDIDSASIDLKAYNNEKKEIDIGAGIKLKLMSVMMSGLWDKKDNA